MLPVGEVIDLDVERKRLAREVEKLQGRGRKLEEQARQRDLLARAPAEIVEEQRERLAETEATSARLAAALAHRLTAQPSQPETRPCSPASPRQPVPMPRPSGSSLRPISPPGGTRFRKPAGAWLRGHGLSPKPHRLALLPDGEGGVTGAAFLVDKPGNAADATGGGPCDRRAALAHRRPRGPARRDLHYGSNSPATARPLPHRRGQERQQRHRPPRYGRHGRSGRGQLALSVFLARDLVNTPANDLGPAELEAAIREDRPGARRHLHEHRRRRSARGRLSHDPCRRPGQQPPAPARRSLLGCRHGTGSRWSARASASIRAGSTSSPPPAYG
ncbi:MAG: hypothetical protein R3C69_18070 [Geminicoccaceae bacterium]